MTVHVSPTMSKEAFLAWVERREERYELAKGRAVMMVRVTLGHALATTNLVVALTARLSPDKYNVAAEAFAVNVHNGVRFPDVVVQPAQPDKSALEAKAPLLIAEVLSPGTLHLDFGDKKREYLSLDTLQAYLVLAADEPRAWAWQRGADGAFVPEPEILEGAEAEIALPVLGITLPLAELYRGVR